MRQSVLIALMAMGFGFAQATTATTVKVEDVQTKSQEKSNVPAPTVKSRQGSLPKTEEINVTDVPVVVLNGLNNTYQYTEIAKVEVSTYNNMDIYQFTLVNEDGDEQVVHFTSTGVEI